MAEPWVRITVNDYRKLKSAAVEARNTCGRALSLGASGAVSTFYAHNWNCVPDAENPFAYIRVYGGYLIVNGVPVYLPVPATPTHKAWYPDPEAETTAAQGPDYFVVALPSLDTAARAALHGTLGFVYWDTTVDPADVTNPFPGKFFVAQDEDAMATAMAASPFVRIVAALLWDKYDDCGYKLRQYFSAPIVLDKLDQTFNINFVYGETDTTVQFSNCTFLYNVAVVTVADLEAVVTGGPVVYLGLEYNSNTKTGTLLQGAALTDVSDATLIDETEKVKLPLYKIVKVGGVWIPILRYADAPVAASYA